MKKPEQSTTHNPSNPDEKEMKAKRKYYGKIFVTLIFFLIIYEYYIYVYEINWKKITGKILDNNLDKNWVYVISSLVVFHYLMLMMLWSLLVTMMTHPGEIPLYWGFYIGDEDYKRKRYCLICNAFKPERSHHCSVCNICVLNMDHHCPWVDNCIGFYNRKYFMQLLFYLCLVTLFIDFSVGYDIYLMIMNVVHMKLKFHEHFRNAAVVIGYGVVVTISILITMFFKFHFNLVLNNSTTIESLDKEHASEYKKFNLSKWENWTQVFGDNFCLWFFPIVTESGRPKGDGLTWKTVSLNESFRESMDKRPVQANPNQASPSNQPNPNFNSVEMRNYQSNYNSNFNQYNSTNPFSPQRNNI